MRSSSRRTFATSSSGGWRRTGPRTARSPAGGTASRRSELDQGGVLRVAGAVGLGLEEHPPLERPEPEDHGDADADDVAPEVAGEQRVLVQDVLTKGEAGEGDAERDRAEKQEQEVFPADAGAGPVPPGPVAVHEVRRRRGDDGRDALGAQWPIRERADDQ